VFGNKLINQVSDTPFDSSLASRHAGYFQEAKDEPKLLREIVGMRLQINVGS